MRLVTWRSYGRFAMLAMINVCFAVVAGLPETPLWLRAAALVLVGWATWSAVDFVGYVRRWEVLSSGDVAMPTVRLPRRVVPVATWRNSTVINSGLIRFVHGFGDPSRSSTDRLAINMYVSGSDLGRWVRGMGKPQ